MPHHTVTNHIIMKDEKYRGEFTKQNSRAFPGSPGRV